MCLLYRWSPFSNSRCLLLYTYLYVCLYVCLSVSVFIYMQVSVNRMSVRCIIISITAGALVVMTTIDAQPRSAANGLTTSILFIYTTYTLLAARRLLFAVITSALLTALQLSLSAGLNLHDPAISKQASVSSLTVYKLPLSITHRMLSSSFWNHHSLLSHLLSPVLLFQ